MKKHNLGWSTGVLYEHDDGTVSFRRPGHLIDSFRLRISDVTAFSETKGGKKAFDHTLHVFGRGGELLSCDVNAGTGVKIEEWFRAHPSFGDDTPAPQVQRTEPSMSAPSSVADELTKLAQLRDAGVLTDAEFQAQKRKLLD